jgi:hypothetical protein
MAKKRKNRRQPGKPKDSTSIVTAPAGNIKADEGRIVPASSTSRLDKNPISSDRDDDLNLTASLPPSDPERASTSRPKLGLPQAQLTALNEKMTNLSLRERWQTRMDEAGDDTSQWRDLSSSVLYFLMAVLARTDRKDSFIAPDIVDADEIVKGFTDDDLREWMDGVQKGLKDGNWEGLLEHRA